jgi:hypothetical protein
MHDDNRRRIAMTATIEETTHLPPSANVVEISGREYVIAPLDEFKVWDEERGREALANERRKVREVVQAKLEAAGITEDDIPGIIAEARRGGK